MHDWYQRRFMPFYNVWAPAAVMFCVVIASAAIVGTFFNQRAQDAEVRARQQTTAKLLHCFDQYAARSSASSVAVRKATIRKDGATEKRDHALKSEGVAFLRVTRQILHHDVTPDAFKDLERTLATRAHAARELARAYRHLNRVRANNPVPDPPSEFCSVQP